MKSFREFFAPYLGDALPEKVGEGTLRSLEIDNENRQVTVKVTFSSPVEREEITQAEKALEACKALRLSRAQILGGFPSGVLFRRMLSGTDCGTQSERCRYQRYL